MFTAARLAISAWRNEDLSYLLRVRGPDLSGGTALRLQVRLAPGTPGDPLISLDRVTDDTLGLKVIDTRVVDGVIETLIRFLVPAARLQALPFDGELGQPFPLAFAFQIAGKTRLHGDLILLDSAIDSDGNSDDREPAYGAPAAPFATAPQQGATLTIAADDVVEVTIDGADLYGPAIERAVDALDTIEGIAGSSYRAVPTYGDREAIPLDKRENGLRVQVMQAGQDASGYIPRVFEWRTDLFAPGGWTGLLTEEEKMRLDLMHGGLGQDKIYGLSGSLDAIRGTSAALAAVKVGNLRAELLAGTTATVAWTRDGARPQGQTVSWSGWSVSLRGDVERFEVRDWSKIERLFVAGNSLSDTTGAVDQWSQLLAAALAVPLTSIARGSSDARQVYKAGAAPLFLTLAAALPAGGSTAVTKINGVAPSLDSYVSPASFLNSYAGDAAPASMTGWVSDGTSSYRATVSIARSDSTDYRIARDVGAGVALTSPVSFTPDPALDMPRSLVGLWIGNNYFYSGVPGEYGDNTNAQLWRDLDALVQQAAGARIFVLPILPAADWTDRGPGTPYNAYQAANARTRARLGQYWLLDAQGRDLVEYIKVFGSDGSANDQADVAAGFTPRSCRYDGLHLNAKGVALVVAFVRAALQLQALPPAIVEGTTVRLTARGTDSTDSAIATTVSSATSLALDKIRPSLFPAGATPRQITSASGFLFPITDANDLLLGGFDNAGRFVASLSPKSIIPKEPIAAPVKAIVEESFSSRLLPSTVTSRAIDPAVSGWLFPLTDDADFVYAGLDKDGRWVCALSDRSIIPQAVADQMLAPYLSRMLPAGAAQARTILSDASGWLFPITDANGQLLGGWDAQGRFVANISSRSIIPGDATGAVATMAALLASTNMGMPSGRLYFSGDSLTAGAGGAGTNYPAVMAGELGLAFVNSAVGGTISTSIGVRQGGIAMLLTLSGGALPADTSEVDVTVYSAEFTNQQSAQTWNGTLGGVPVQLRRYSSASPNEGVTAKYTIRRLAAASQATPIADGTRFLADIFTGNELDHHYIWAGRNDAKNTRAARLTLRDNILRMIDRVKHDRFAVLAVTNGTGETKGSSAYDQIMDVNRILLEAIGPGRFMDHRKYLASYDALSDAGISPTSQDDTDVAGDTIPASLRSDSIHGNAAFYTLLGKFAARWHRGRGWATGI